MAQTGYTPILIYSSSTTTNAPAANNLTNSTLGSELAINITDGKLFYKDNANAVQVIAWKVTPTTAGGTGLTSYNQGDLLYYNSGTTLTALAKNTTATRYLSNTGANNNPAWAQIDLSNGVTSTLPVGNGGTGTGTAFTDGSIVFAGASGVYSQDNTNLFWDNTNKYLGIGLNNPSASLQIFNATSSVFSLDGNSSTTLRLTRYSSDATAPILNSRKYRGTFSSPAAVQTSDFVLSVAGLAFDGTAVRSIAAINGFVETFTGTNNVSGALIFNTRPSGVGAFNLERVRIHSSGGVSIGNTTDPGATNLSVSGKVSAANTFESTAFLGINSLTATTIATGISFLAVIRDRGNGDTALVLYENNVTPVIVSQTASKFVTGAPGASQIQIANLSGGGGITALSGATIGNTNINITIIKNQ